MPGNFSKIDEVIALSKVAADHFPSFVVKLLLRDNWNNIEALAKYEGPLEIFAAKDDTVIPITHAKALAATKPKAHFHEIEGGDHSFKAPKKFGVPQEEIYEKAMDEIVRWAKGL